MHKQTVAQRARQNPTISGQWSHVAAPTFTSHPAYVGRARKAPRMTATQRDSQGRLSAWSRSPYAPKGGWR